MTLEEIAKQLGTSKTNLTRALRIELNLMILLDMKKFIQIF